VGVSVAAAAPDGNLSTSDGFAKDRTRRAGTGRREIGSQFFGCAARFLKTREAAFFLISAS